MRYFISHILLLLLTACDGVFNHIELGTLGRNRITHTAISNDVVMALSVAKGTQVKIMSIHICFLSALLGAISPSLLHVFVNVNEIINMGLRLFFISSIFGVVTSYLF